MVIIRLSLVEKNVVFQIIIQVILVYHSATPEYEYTDFICIIIIYFLKYICSQFYSKKHEFVSFKSKLVLLGSLKRHILNSLKPSQ
jgi:hypothetical protein